MKLPGVWMRGGTSKCWVFERDDLSKSNLGIENTLLRVFGSPDVRQLDGIGGGTSTTSKAVIVSPTDHAGADLSFLFAQVGIDEAKVDWGSNCGNCSATVALYAIEQGWIVPTSEVTEVRVLNENTDQIIIQRVPTPQGRLPRQGTAEMPGSVYPGFEVKLGFEEPEGKTTGKLFPTGQNQESFQIDGSTYRASLLDAGAPTVLVSARELGLWEADRKDWTSTSTDTLSLLEEIRRAAAVRMGLCSNAKDADRAIPKIGIVGPTSNEEASLRIQMLSMGNLHPAMPITGSVAVSIGAQTPQTTVHEALSGRSVDSGLLKIDTPSGILTTFYESKGGKTLVGSARTCRTLAEATLFIPEDPMPLEVRNAS